MEAQEPGRGIVIGYNRIEEEHQTSMPVNCGLYAIYLSYTMLIFEDRNVHT